MEVSVIKEIQTSYNEAIVNIDIESEAAGFCPNNKEL